MSISGEVVCRNDFQAHVHSYESEEPQYFVLFCIKQLFCSVMIMFLLVLPNLKNHNSTYTTLQKC